VKAVVDSSVLISAFLIAGSLPGRLVRAGLEGRFRLLLSTSILHETTRSLRDKPGLRRFGYSEPEVEQFVRDLTAAAEVVEAVPAIPPTCRDPADDHVLAAALVSGADYLVTGDKDILTLGSFEGIRIIKVRQLVDELGLGDAG
jgi:uncharacterized protein